MSNFEDQLKSTLHRMNQIKPAELDGLMKTISERAKTDSKIARCLSLAKQLKEEAGGIDVKLPSPPGTSGGVSTQKITALDVVVIIILILMFP